MFCLIYGCICVLDSFIFLKAINFLVMSKWHISHDLNRRDWFWFSSYILDKAFGHGTLIWLADVSVSHCWYPSWCFLQDSINSASSVTQTLSREVLEGQRKLMALATSRTNSGTLNTLPIQLNNGPLLHEKVGNLANYLLVFVAIGLDRSPFYSVYMVIMAIAILLCISGWGTTRSHKGASKVDFWAEIWGGIYCSTTQKWCIYCVLVMLSGMSEMFPYFQFNRQVSPVGIVFKYYLWLA